MPDTVDEEWLKDGTAMPERCGACSHFSPHTRFSGCGVEVFDGNRFGRCGCKARNDDAAGPEGMDVEVVPAYAAESVTAVVDRVRPEENFG